MRRQHVHRDCTRTAACSLSLSRLRPGPTHSSRRARPWPIGFEGAFKPPLAPSLIHMPACPPGPDSGCRPRPPSLTASAARAQVSAPAAAVRRGGLAGGFDTFIVRTPCWPPSGLRHRSPGVARRIPARGARWRLRHLHHPHSAGRRPASGTDRRVSGGGAARQPWLPSTPCRPGSPPPSRPLQPPPPPPPPRCGAAAAKALASLEMAPDLLEGRADPGAGPPERTARGWPRAPGPGPALTRPIPPPGWGGEGGAVPRAYMNISNRS